VPYYSSSFKEAQDLRNDIYERKLKDQFMEALNLLSHTNGEGPWSRWQYMNLPPIFTARAVLIVTDHKV